jgi:hypothetical protein
MRRLATWLIVTCVGALGLAAGITALVTDDDGKPAVPAMVSTPATVPLPGCRDEQLALAVEMPGGSPVVVLRHIAGPPCDVGALNLATTIRDQRGERSPIQAVQDAFTGEISPGLEFVSGIVYLAWCDQKGPLVATIRAGELSATRRSRSVVVRIASTCARTSLERHRGCASRSLEGRGKGRLGIRKYLFPDT